jgi:hypothetical protein
MIDDQNGKIDHSVHWSKLKKHHKKDIEEKALFTMLHIKDNDGMIEKLKEKAKEDAATKLQTQILMSRIAGHIASATEQETEESNIQEQRKKPFLRTAMSLKRDEAIEKLVKVMNEQYGSKHAVGIIKEEEDGQQVKKEEEQEKAVGTIQEEEDESWKLLIFDESPARKRERHDTYSVMTQRRKPSRPNTPARERKGEHPLDLIGVIEVVPHASPRETWEERYPRTEKITVHASDFIKYGDDVEILKTVNLKPPSKSEHAAVEHLRKSTDDSKQSIHDRLAAGIPRSRAQSASRSPPVSRPTSQPPSRPSSARPRVARPGDTWPSSQPSSRPPSRPSSARTGSARPGKARHNYNPFLPLKAQCLQ